MGASLLAMASGLSTSMLNVILQSRASSLPHGTCIRRTVVWRRSSVGASLLAMAIQQAKQVFARSIKRRGTS
ncbi:hypothetical protein C1X64_29010 [Pseudomonas sp. GW456-E7]|nr:hypothetical protein C1X64_29010 [Pseudomonas sp. GW456-E7]